MLWEQARVKWDLEGLTDPYSQTLNVMLNPNDKTLRPSLARISLKKAGVLHSFDINSIEFPNSSFNWFKNM